MMEKNQNMDTNTFEAGQVKDMVNEYVNVDVVDVFEHMNGVDAFEDVVDAFENVDVVDTLWDAEVDAFDVEEVVDDIVQVEI